MFKFITDKPLWVNILAGIGLVVLIVVLFFSSLDWITGYGHKEKVPSVTGQHILAAQKILEDKGFQVAIQDSVYIDSLAKQAVIKQSPEADAEVKTGRTIYLTVNRSIPPQVEMPNLSGFSIRSAEMYLQSLGLKLGYVTYKPDIARNAVLEQLYNDAPIKPGSKIAIGSVISFVLGSGVGGGEAKAYLSTININLGAVVASGAIKDSSLAFVIKQSPNYIAAEAGINGEKVINKIKQGQVVDLYISDTAPVKDTTVVRQ
ncbi:MAG: hypothetical protein RL596_1968 [Bacteroidota bacterium]